MNDNVTAMMLDLASLESVREFAGKIDVPVYALDNNAGISGSSSGQTVDGLDPVFQSNHLGHFLLTNLLLPKFDKNFCRLLTLEEFSAQINGTRKDDFFFDIRGFQRALHIG